MRRDLVLLGLLLAACAPPSTGLTSREGNAVAALDDLASLKQRLAAIPNVHDVRDADLIGEVPIQLGCALLQLSIRQPVDHQSPEGDHFDQQLVLLHCDPSAPMVFSPDGYGFEIDFFMPELVDRLHSNWLWAEHRYYGPSTPANDPDDKFLTVRQSADDHHAIVTALKTIYRGRWISTGASNGGMNATFHRRFYPDDVDGTVAYVAPFTQGAPDPRFPPFIDQLGDQACRDRVIAFQRAVLSRLDELAATVPLSDYHDPRASLHDGALSYRFAFWQYNGDCDGIPAPDADAATIVSVLSQSSAMFNDATQASFASYYAQTKTELGFPAGNTSGLEDLLVGWKDETSDRYDGSTMKGVVDWIAADADRILFIYGGHDAWSAAAATAPTGRDALVMYAHSAGHEADLTMLDVPDREKALSHLASWAGVALVEPQAATIERDRLGRQRAAVAMRLVTPRP